MTNLPPIAVEAIAFLADGAPTGSRLHIVVDEATAEELTVFLGNVLPEHRVSLFPGWDVLPFDPIRPSVDVMGQRMAVLARCAVGEPETIIVALPTLLQKLPPVEAAQSLTIQTGDQLNTDALAEFARSVGYVEDDRVDLPGEIAFHGTTIEVFAAGDGHPCRIEMDGSTVKSLRCYDPVTQRSTGDVTRLDVAPVSEFPLGEDKAWPSMSTLFDHVGKAKITALAGTLARDTADFSRLKRQHKDAVEDSPSPPAFEARIVEPKRWASMQNKVVELPLPEWNSLPRFAQEAHPRRAFGEWHKDRRGTTILVAGSERERSRLARMIGNAAHKADGWTEAMTQPTAILIADLSAGVIVHDLALVTAHDILGSQAEYPSRVARWTLPSPVLTPDFDDIVVHEDHGMARFGGLEPMDAAFAGAEAIRLTFRNDEHLLVPAQEAGKIWRYGSDKAGVSVDKLHGKAWPKRHEATRAALSTLAQKLVVAMADRQAAQSPKLVAERARFEDFVTGFAHSLTLDQAAAVTDILADLASGHPMDRLLIGDVGYGKTEVALRAAAAAVLAGRQVAICAPTTVLARQHYETFRRRFAPLGIAVGHLSRLATLKDARATRAGLADGSLRVVVGTHAVAGKGITFADLGLMVIDEEQRFGAAQKKALRTLGRDAHVLSMTATPIPRTLQTALIGLQDLSILTTPPAKRRPIRTTITLREDEALTRALHREKRRGGQSYIVVPRIEDIPDVSACLKRLLPTLDIRDVHGGLSAEEIDRTMVDFAAGRGDVLLATGIIESGLDVARANTMIVLRPELFGLAQLHQLRGRVGRGAVQAWCHLMPSEELSDTARTRLEALVAADRLGAGMALSVSDLDHRGAGDLLGDSQAGHVRRIGVGLYQASLTRALKAAAKAEEIGRLPDYHGDWGHLPTDYIAEPGPRLDLYHRLAHVETAADIDRIADEITDRFGPPPKALDTLTHAARLRILAKTCGVSGITIGPKGLSLEADDPSNLAERLSDEDVICADGRLNLACDDEASRAEIILERLQ